MALEPSRILDGPEHYLYQGPWPSLGHWLELRARADELHRLLVVVNTHWASEDPPGNLLRPGDQHLWLPMPDGPFEALSPAWLRLVSMQVGDTVAAGALVYVHCLAGVSRSTLVVTGTLMVLRQMAPLEALAFVQARRPVAHPVPAFEALLLDLQHKHVRGELPA